MLAIGINTENDLVVWSVDVDEKCNAKELLWIRSHGIDAERILLVENDQIIDDFNV